MNGRVLGLLAAAEIAIGAAAIFARFALTAAGPLSVSALRLAIAAVPVVLLAAVRGRYARFDTATERRLLVAGVALAVHFAAWIASLRYASVAVSTLLVCSTPVFIEAWLLARTRRIRPIVLGSLVLAFAGVAIVAGVPDRTDTPLGIALALTGAVAMAVYLVFVRASDPRYSTLAVVARTYPVAAIVLGIAAAVTRDGFPAPDARIAWAGILAMALISQLIGHTAINVAVRVLSPTFVAMAALLEPVFAAVTAALVFGEHPAPLTAAGALLVFAAIALALRAEPSAQISA